MKKLLFLTSFLILSVLSVKSQKLNVKPIPSSVINAYDTAQYAFDTVKVRIQIDNGSGFAVLINGYLVRKFISYGHLHPWGKLYSKEKFMDQYYQTIDPINVWDYKEREWKPEKPRNIWFLTPGSGIFIDSSTNGTMKDTTRVRISTYTSGG